MNINMQIRPSYLPQVHMPVDLVAKKLDEEGVEYEYIQVNPNDLNVSQGITTSDEVEKVNLDDKHPVFTDKNLTLCDGHHRFVSALTDNKLLTAIKVNLEFRDTCRILNKIQDIYEYEQHKKMEEVISQDVINSDNNIDSNVSDSEFLSSLEEDNTNIQAEKPSKNEKKIIAYRKEPIKENSVIGNYFSLTPIEGFNKYEIEFENLLDTNDLGIHYKDSQIPVEVLAKVWFPHVNFEKISENYNTPSINLKNKAIAEKAKTLGFDGIQYGDKLIQGLK